MAEQIEKPKARGRGRPPLSPDQIVERAKRQEAEATAFEDAFKEARRRLLQRFKTAEEAAKEIDPLIDEGTLKKFYNETDSKTRTKSKERLIWYFLGGRDREVYRYIYDKIGISREIGDISANKIVGTYKYYRYYAPGVSLDGHQYVDGKISIYISQETICFDHRSRSFIDEHGESGDPEHRGFVIYGKGFIFLIGAREGVLRLIVAEAPSSGKNYMVGLVLSVRSGTPYDPFAARFVIVPDSNIELQTKLEDKSPTTLNKKKTTKGEKEFFRITNGDYAYLMLALHPDKSKNLAKDEERGSPDIEYEI